MTEADAQKLAIAVAKALQQARSVSDSEHYDHHRWISAKIASENARRDFWRTMQAHVAKWGAISILSAGFYALWLGIRQVLRAAL